MFFPRSNFNQSFCGVVLAVVVVFAADVVLDVVVVVDVAAFRKSFEFVLFHHHL